MNAAAVKPWQNTEIESNHFSPESPNSLQQAGLSESLVEQLLLKNLYFRPEVTGRELSKALGLRFSVIEPVLQVLRQARLLETKRSSSIGTISASFALSESGRTRAKEYLEGNQLVGPAPVPLDQYVDAVHRQHIKPGWMTKAKLKTALQDAIISDEYLGMVGPAVNAFRSMLVYGKPGNGKSFLSEQLSKIDSEPVFIPYVVEAEGQLIKVFDSLHHQRVDADSVSVALTEEAQFDQRWANCRRPFLTTGGELTMDMLDLMYIPGAKIYDAPYQMKANNGIYLVDDFGRQQITPTELLNRWIYPLDTEVDFLRFRTGGKIQVPFECFIIFSSNLNPTELGDEAFLRRLEYKLFMKNPSEEEYTTIFRQYCAQIKIEYPEDLPQYVLDRHYRNGSRKLRRCHPRDVIRVAVDLMNFESRPYRLTRELVDRAFALRFVTADYTEE